MYEFELNFPPEFTETASAIRTSILGGNGAKQSAHSKYEKG